MAAATAAAVGVASSAAATADALSRAVAADTADARRLGERASRLHAAASLRHAMTARGVGGLGVALRELGVAAAELVTAVGLGGLAARAAAAWARLGPTLSWPAPPEVPDLWLPAASWRVLWEWNADRERAAAAAQEGGGGGTSPRPPPRSPRSKASYRGGGRPKPPPPSRPRVPRASATALPALWPTSTAAALPACWPVVREDNLSDDMPASAAGGGRGGKGSGGSNGGRRGTDDDVAAVPPRAAPPPPLPIPPSPFEAIAGDGLPETWGRAADTDAVSRTVDGVPDTTAAILRVSPPVLSPYAVGGEWLWSWDGAGDGANGGRATSASPLCSGAITLSPWLNEGHIPGSVATAAAAAATPHTPRPPSPPVGSPPGAGWRGVSDATGASEVAVAAAAAAASAAAATATAASAAVATAAAATEAAATAIGALPPRRTQQARSPPSRPPHRAAPTAATPLCTQTWTAEGAGAAAYGISGVPRRRWLHLLRGGATDSEPEDDAFWAGVDAINVTAREEA